MSGQGPAGRMLTQACLAASIALLMQAFITCCRAVWGRH